MTVQTRATSSDERYVRALARGGTASVAGAAVSALGGFVVVLLVTRGYPAQVAGTLFATTSLFLIVLTVAQLGSEAGLPRWIPVKLASGQRTAALRAVLAALVPSLGLSVLLAVVGLLAAPALGPLLVDASSVPLAVEQIRVLSLALPVAVVANTLLAATRGYGTMRPTVLADRIGVTVLQALGVAVTIVVGADAGWLVVAWSVPYLVSLAVATTWLVRRVRRPAPRSRDDRTGAEVRREYWAFTAPRVGVSISQVVLRRADVVLVSALLSAADAAVYTAATRFVVVAGLGVLGIQQTLAPQLSRAFARGDHEQAQHLFLLATAWMMFVSWPMYLVLTAAAPQLLVLFGPGYAVGAAVVAIGSAGMLYGTSAGAVDTALVMAGHSLLSLVNSLVVVVVNVALNLLLIPRLGIVGAASAWAVSVLLRNVLAQVQVRRLNRLRLYGRAAAWVAGVAVLAYGPLLAWAAVADPPPPLPPMVAAAGVATLIYLTVLWRVPSVYLPDLVTAARRRAP